ncbi:MULTISPECIES: flavodoxin domain-containing protein [unclassified Kitasatospora]|uniref:flavodoxin domain-containing protein n=1 Tax=unclassified Kitasatospora TaxID=2633591 RepID=UPI0033F0FCE1
MKVFVGYATAHGSTRGVAERIAAVLERNGHQVVLGSLPRPTGPRGFDAAVLGSAVHDGKWLPEAVESLRHDAADLARCRVWLYSVSLVGERTSAFRPGVARRLLSLKARRGAELPAELRAVLQPVGRHDFAGAVSPQHWPIIGRLVFRVMGGRYGDHRDWAEIDDWADGIARTLTEGLAE